MSALWTSDEVQAALAAASITAPFEAEGVTFDSRAVGKGDLFFALSGETTDGHGFVADAGLHVFPYTCALLWDVRNPSYKNAGGEATAMRDLEGNIVMARYGGQPLAMVSPVHPAYQRLMESVITSA